MNKFVFLLLFLISFEAVSADLCKRMEIKGTFRMIDAETTLVVNEGSLSEQKFKVDIPIRYKGAPYFNVTSLGTYLVKDRMIVRFEKIQRDLPDPLHPKKHSFVNAKGESKCN